MQAAGPAVLCLPHEPVDEAICGTADPAVEDATRRAIVGRIPQHRQLAVESESALFDIRAGELRVDAMQGLRRRVPYAVQGGMPLPAIRLSTVIPGPIPAKVMTCSSRLEAAGTQCRHRFEGQHAIGATSELSSNFGFNLPWWDRLLGTYRALPRRGHKGMVIGLEQFRSARELRLDRMLLQPLRGPASGYAVGNGSE
jgi:hypothetical protein